MSPNVGTNEKATNAGSPQRTASTELAAPTAETAEPNPTPRKPLCRQEHVLNCQFARWYEVFKHCSPRSVVLELSEDVVRYLQEDGVVLPEGFEMSCGKERPEDSDDDVDWEDGQDDNELGSTLANQRPDFPELRQRLCNAIVSLGGSVFPKLNWSAPQDAAWVNGGTLKCSSPGDVACLLKSSNFVSHDLNHAFEACTDASISRPETFTLVLRKWCNFHPGMHFRCFVRERQLVGVSQRDCTSYYSYLEEDAPRLSSMLADFFAAEVCKKFPDPDCVTDVYIDNRSRVWLLDINPYSTVTDSLLFDWEEGVLTAPLPHARTRSHEDSLPPDVFMRLHVGPPRPSDAPTSAEGGATGANKESPVSDTRDPRRDKLGSIVACTLGADRSRDFEFRCVRSNSHIIPDPMGRYRAPADVAMGTLSSVGTGAEALGDLIDAVRQADERG